MLVLELSCHPYKKLTWAWIGIASASFSGVSLAVFAQKALGWIGTSPPGNLMTSIAGPITMAPLSPFTVAPIDWLEGVVDIGQECLVSNSTFGRAATVELYVHDPLVVLLRSDEGHYPGLKAAYLEACLTLRSLELATS